MLDDFFDSLPHTSDRHFARRHSLEINTSQSFVVAWQSKHSAAPAALRHLGPILPAPEPNAGDHAELFSQPADPIQLRPLPDHLPGKFWKIRNKGGKSPHDQLVPFGGNQIPDSQYYGWRWIASRCEE